MLITLTTGVNSLIIVSKLTSSKGISQGEDPQRRTKTMFGGCEESSWYAKEPCAAAY